MKGEWMTILLATKRDSFAILAAGGLEARPDGPPSSLGPKLVPHTSLPLAFGLTGSSWWVPAPTQQGKKPAWRTADFWFGFQRPSPLMAWSLKRLAEQEE